MLRVRWRGRVRVRLRVLVRMRLLMRVRLLMRRMLMRVWRLLAMLAGLASAIARSVRGGGVGAGVFSTPG